MSFLFRFLLCVVLVLATSVLGAMAWDQSDQVAAAQNLPIDMEQSAAPSAGRSSLHAPPLRAPLHAQ